MLLSIQDLEHLVNFPKAAYLEFMKFQEFLIKKSRRSQKITKDHTDLNGLTILTLRLYIYLHPLERNWH